MRGLLYIPTPHTNNFKKVKMEKFILEEIIRSSPDESEKPKLYYGFIKIWEDQFRVSYERIVHESRNKPEGSDYGEVQIKKAFN